MIVRRASPALLLLLSCTRSTELLPPVDAAPDRPQVIDSREPIDAPEPTEPDSSPDSAFDSTGDSTPRRHYDFCPTTIDIYGGYNFLLPGCGGPTDSPDDLQEGLLGSGNPGYDSTLAGRLAIRLAGDPDLVERFGSQWAVRSCAGPQETLSQLTPPLVEDSCGFGAPSTDGTYQTVCLQSPAPVMLLAASMLDDGCHGGGANPLEPDDQDTFTRHFQARLHTFLAGLRPKTALVGNRTEWTAAPQSMALPGFAPNSGCWWKRPEWETQALASWSSDSVEGTEVTKVGNLNQEFKRHHSCCHELDLLCAPPWFNRRPDTVNCDGDQEIVNFWYTELKTWLLGGDFDCP
ncbi:MAG TPA: hypothetical protein VF518_11850 [Polyangia bacterium]